MQPQKRSWIYAGISHPPGVALAAATRRRHLPAGSRLLLAGDRHAAGLGPFLRQLCRDGEVGFDLELDPAATLESWAASGRLLQLTGNKPRMVVVSLALRSDALPVALAPQAEAARLRGVSLVWLRPPEKNEQTKRLRALLDAAKIPSFHSEALPLDRGPDGHEPTARGYAGWAGALWRWID